MVYSRWNIPRGTPEVPAALTRAGYSRLLAAVLAVRGYDTPEAARDFLDAGPEKLGDPLLLEDMDKAVERLRRAIETRENVAVYGDYDVDGITSTCILTDYLRSRGVNCRWYIPNRLEEGYGVNSDAIRELCERQVTLIVTVDCGVTAIAEAEFARTTLGVDLIVTDHHECQNSLPAAVAVVDPKRPGCAYPRDDCDLAGVGVAFKLLCALEGSPEPILERYADLVAVGTIADVMPLAGENRYIVRRGLEKLNSDPRPGLKALVEEAGLWGRDKPNENRRLTAGNIGFTLAPRLNASGRLGQVERAMQLLLAEDPAKARDCAEKLCELNRERQEMEAKISQQAQEMLGAGAPDGPIVLAHDDWHQGVIGITASRLAEKYGVPAIMICFTGDEGGDPAHDRDLGKGSCRSCGGFNLFEALSACAEHLEGFGGHALAAGLTIRRENIDAFREALREYYKARAADYVSTLDIDLCVDAPDLLTLEGVEDLDRLEPCGTGNLRPRLALLGAELKELTPIGGGKHLRLRLEKDGAAYEAVFFHQTAESVGLRAGDCVDVAFYPQINEFRDRRSVQLLVCDIRYNPTAVINENYPAGRRALPRSEFETLWRALDAKGGAYSEAVERFCAGLCPALDDETLCLCLMVFRDLGLLEFSLADGTLSVRRLPGACRAPLESSALLRRLRRGSE